MTRYSDGASRSRRALRLAMSPQPHHVENFFTIDLEDWFHGNYAGPQQPSSTSTVEADTAPLLALLDRHRVRATVFCLGRVAAAHPRLVKRIHDAEAEDRRAHAVAIEQGQQRGGVGL